MCLIRSVYGIIVVRARMVAVANHIVRPHNKYIHAKQYKNPYPYENQPKQRNIFKSRHMFLYCTDFIHLIIINSSNVRR